MSSLAQMDKLITKQSNKALNIAIQKAMGKVEYAVMRLMQYSKIPLKIGQKRVFLKAEQRLCIEYADKLRDLTAKEKLKGIWCHVANERQAGWFTHLILSRMGMIKGSPDYWHIWEGGGCVIEFKVDGELEEYQEYFRIWAWSENTPHAVCRSVNSAIDKLHEFGALN